MYVDWSSMNLIIGIGAPVSAYLPGVADIFHTRLVVPKNSRGRKRAEL